MKGLPVWAVFVRIFVSMLASNKSEALINQYYRNESNNFSWRRRDEVAPAHL